MRLTYTDSAFRTTHFPSQVLPEVQLTQVQLDLFLPRFFRSFLTSFTIGYDAFHSFEWCIASFPWRMIKPPQSNAFL